MNSHFGSASAGISGGKPPEITTVSERATNIMPSVVMKLGMAKRIVTKPLMKPIAAATASPAAKAGANGTPAASSTAIVIGVSANTEPTERSNSPQIISSVTPIATSPISGRRPSMPRRFCPPRKTPFERIWKTTRRMSRNTTAASSGFSR